MGGTEEHTSEWQLDSWERVCWGVERWGRGGWPFGDDGRQLQEGHWEGTPSPPLQWLPFSWTRKLSAIFQEDSRSLSVPLSLYLSAAPPPTFACNVSQLSPLPLLNHPPHTGTHTPLALCQPPVNQIDCRCVSSVKGDSLLLHAYNRHPPPATHPYDTAPPNLLACILSVDQKTYINSIYTRRPYGYSIYHRPPPHSFPDVINWKCCRWWAYNVWAINCPTSSSRPSSDSDITRAANLWLFYIRPPQARSVWEETYPCRMRFSIFPTVFSGTFCSKRRQLSVRATSRFWLRRPRRSPRMVVKKKTVLTYKRPRDCISRALTAHRKWAVINWTSAFVAVLIYFPFISFWFEITLISIITFIQSDLWFLTALIDQVGKNPSTFFQALKGITPVDVIARFLHSQQ